MLRSHDLSQQGLVSVCICSHVGSASRSHVSVTRCCWVLFRKSFPKLSKIDIQCPIKQLVFGTRGAYRCMLIEQKPLNAEEFQQVSETDMHRPPHKERDKDDTIIERAFWSR